MSMNQSRLSVVNVYCTKTIEHFHTDPNLKHPQHRYNYLCMLDLVNELYKHDWNDYDVNQLKSLLSGYFILRQLKSGCV